MGLTWGVTWPMVLLFSVMISLVIVGKVRLKEQERKQKDEAFVGSRRERMLAWSRKPLLELERNRCVAEWS